MWLMLEPREPEDSVMSTGTSHSSRGLLEAAFGAVGLDGEEHVEIDPKLIRPAEVDILCGDASKAREKLGWEPEVGFDELIKMMVEADLEVVQKAENGIAFAASLRNGNGNENGNGSLKAENRQSNAVAAPRGGE